MRVLQIGQLPTEMGGNYTTGVARVVGELSRYKFGDNDVFLMPPIFQMRRPGRFIQIIAHISVM